jgi:regulator of sigma E protease
LDLSLIAVWTPDWAWWGYLAQGILALGLVILIHEFGHFAAAKLCGVRVEKFYIGFDFFGWRLFRFRWGETEYGLGAFPLGGYVAMFGQTDNPAKQAEEAERAKALKAGTAAEGLVSGTTVESETLEPGLIVDGQWHPRSYPAQSIPERMFIISAGVIMNSITAFLFGIWAYSIGVEHTPATLGDVTPGLPAWESDLRNGDQITKINDIEHPRFEADLRSRAVLVDMSKGLELRIQRPGVSEPLEMNVFPRKLRKDMYPTLGVTPISLPQLAKLPKDAPPTMRGSPARDAEPKFAGGDEIVRIDDREIKTYEDIVEAQTELADKKIKVVVRRSAAPKDEKGTTPDAAKEEITIEVAPRPMRMLGMTMELGPIVSIQKNSPAERDGLRVGDKIVSIDGVPAGDPVTLAERLRRKQKESPGKSWAIAVRRPASNETLPDYVVEVTPREADRDEQAQIRGAPFGVPVLGIALPINPTVAEVDPNGPAAKAGVKQGDVFTQLRTIPAEPSEGSDEPTETSAKFELTDTNEHNWPALNTVIQGLSKSTKIELTTKDKRVLTLEPFDSDRFYVANRGWVLEIPRAERKAETLDEAFRFAWQDTRDAMTQVYKFLNRMAIGQIPASNVGGMITIAQQASTSASIGFSQLLLFLLMLSCNLAVLNFLPIPVLDGGHMVFLAYEGIFRRPPPVRLYGALQMIGFVLLMSLMAFALFNDVVRLTK